MEVTKRLFWQKLLLPFIKSLLRCCVQFLFLESSNLECWFFLLIVSSNMLWLWCFTGSWKKQKREIKAFTMEELRWFKWIFLVSSIYLLWIMWLSSIICGYQFFSYVNRRSVDCFRLGWPMRADADFFCLETQQSPENNGVSNDGSFYCCKHWLLLHYKYSKAIWYYFYYCVYTCFCTS